MERANACVSGDHNFSVFVDVWWCRHNNALQEVSEIEMK